MKETRYYLGVHEEPEYDDYGQPFGLWRTVRDRDKKIYKTERWNEDTGEWEHNTYVAEASGIGGGSDLRPITEDQAIEYMNRER